MLSAITHYAVPHCTVVLVPVLVDVQQVQCDKSTKGLFVSRELVVCPPPGLVYQTVAWTRPTVLNLGKTQMYTDADFQQEVCILIRSYSTTSVQNSRSSLVQFDW